MRVIMLILMLLLSYETREGVLTIEAVGKVYKVAVTNEDRVIKILSDSGYSTRMQQIILAQGKFESGDFKNSLTRKYNNVFAMLHSKYDPYSKGNWGRAEGRSGYAVYGSLDESVYARMWYQRNKKYPSDTTVEAYVKHIKSKGYFEDNEKRYLKGMRYWIEKDSHLFENKFAGSLVGESGI